MRETRGCASTPVLGLGGTASFFFSISEAMLSEIAENVTVRPVEDSGHWIAEEAPEHTLAALTAFLAPYRAGAASR